MMQARWMLCWMVLVATAYSIPNQPYPDRWSAQNAVFAPFSGAPKTLDPAKSYASDSNVFLAQIVEPPLQYHYLKMPYVLEPAAASVMPTVSYLDASHNPTTLHNANRPVAFTVYDIHLRSDLRYAPHPALIKPPYARSNPLPGNMATRTATADDFVYEIKRLASPKINSPIYGVMAEHIVGFKACNAQLQKVLKQHPAWAKKEAYFDLRPYSISGVKALGPHHLQITLYGQYRQFKYWLAMPFFAPVPWEVDQYYHLPGQQQHNIGFDWSPMGTGPYQLVENNPNQRMVLARNPHFHPEFYPSEGMPGDRRKGYLQAEGKRLPLVDRFVFTLEKESVASWHKFLQGYYDRSGVSSDNFDQVIALSQQGDVGLSARMTKQGIHLTTSVSPSIFYFGFNMLDAVVGGTSKPSQALRQAISIALNYEEYITIFLNGRGVAAQGPIPENIWGHRPGQAGLNPYVYRWHQGAPQRRSLREAKQLMVQAGYPKGIDPKTGRPLVLHYDTVSSSGPDDKARFNWMRKQFAQLGIVLDIRATQYNRFQDKMRQGQAQMFSWGWMADYPDPENFLFLLYGPNGKVKYHGENASNYMRPQFDRCFEKMRNMANGPARQRVVDQCVAIVQRDAPWVWGFYPKSFVLAHRWMQPIKPNAMANNVLKYYQVHAKDRRAQQIVWNRPRWSILGWVLVAILSVLIGLLWRYACARKASIMTSKVFK